MRTRRLILSGVFGLLAMGLLGATIVQGARETSILPPRSDELDRFVRSARVEAPSHQGKLTIFPVVVDGPAARFDCLTMEGAMDRGWLRISEYAGGEVNRVYVRNEGKLPVFLMSGEMIAGAKQDRTISQDTLIPAQTKVALDVYCVERGRWVQRTEHFLPARQAAPAGIRSTALAASPGAAQAEVWSEVAGYQARTRTENPTGSLQESYQSPQLRARLESERAAATREMALLWDRKQVHGVIAAVGGEIIAADVFYSPSLFRKLWPRLLDSYLVDAVSRPEGRGRVSQKEAERLLRSALGASRRERDTPGAGRLVELRGETMGSALIYRSAVVHLQIFPAVYALEGEPRRPRTPSLEFRRERLQQEQTW